MSNKIKSYRDLIVWQKSIELVDVIYDLTNELPRDEKYNLVSQLRRAAVSIPSNIAEGSMRGTRKDYSSFLKIAIGSVAEVSTQIEICYRRNYIKERIYKDTLDSLDEISKMLRSMINKLTPKN